MLVEKNISYRRRTMKRIISIILVAIMVFGAIALVSCNTPEKNETLKLGLGLYVGTPSVANATEDKDGSAKTDITAAVVTVDKDGKIVACELDTTDSTVKHTADGKAISGEGFKTKYEQGAGYNMVTYGGAAKEWYEQADAFESVVKGKTLSEVKALVAGENKGNGEVVSAGCTIMVNEFVLAIEKAYNNAKDSEATASDTLKLGVYTAQTATDAEGDKNGSNKLETTFFAAAVNAEGKIAAATVDTVEITYTFDDKGVSTFDATKEIQSKREQGDSYGMVQYAGSAKEWYAQADAFAALCIGKTAGDVAALMGNDGKGTADVQSAGCTIYVSGFVKAATKVTK